MKVQKMNLEGVRRLNTLEDYNGFIAYANPGDKAIYSVAPSPRKDFPILRDYEAGKIVPTSMVTNILEQGQRVFYYIIVRRKD